MILKIVVLSFKHMKNEDENTLV